jgi:hypothetical protein
MNRFSVAASFVRRAARLGMALAAVTSAGCHDSGDTRVTVQYVPRVDAGVVQFQAALQAGQVTKAFAADATADPAPVLEMETPASGFVVVGMALLDAQGPIGGGTTAIELRRDADFSVLVEIDSVNPSTGCTTCLGSKAFALSAVHQRVLKDSIWMVWSATSGGSAITK